MTIGANVRLLTGNHLEGIGRYALETIKCMAKAHPEDNWVLFFDRKVDLDFDFPENVKQVVLSPQARHPILWRWWFDVSITRALKRYNVDVFYSPDGYTSLTSKVPSVMVIHDLAYLHYAEYHDFVSLKDYEIFVPKYLRKAHSVVTVSNFVKSDIINHFPDLAEKIVVAYNAYENFKTNEVDVSGLLKSNDPFFLYIGSLNPRKNIDRLIEGFLAFNAGNDLKYKLILAGKVMKMPPRSLDLISKSPNVIYFGPVTEDQKTTLIRKAFAMTYVSVFEGFGIPILEGFAHGCPVITSDATSMPEVANGAAILVDPTNINSIAEGMKKVTNQLTRNTLIELGHQRVKDFKWQDSAEIIYNELERVYKNSTS